MQRTQKTLIRALSGETLPTPPVWMMRQAGRYLPEYRATRAQAGDFLSLCYNSDLATEVTLQPIRRYGFDAAILFADILLIPQALGAKLWFEAGEGPRLEPITSEAEFAALTPADAVHETLAPIYQTVRNLSAALPKETTLIGFAGAPWTVATYMIAGRGTKDQGPARQMLYAQPQLFDRLIARLTEATITYLDQQIIAGAEVVKLFDSWAGALPGRHFKQYAIKPAAEIQAALKAKHPDVKFIGFPRGAGIANDTYLDHVRPDALALDTAIDPIWAAKTLQPKACVQGNLDPMLMVTGGTALIEETRATCRAFANGPHIFNLGHGITPEANPANVETMLETIRNRASWA